MIRLASVAWPVLLLAAPPVAGAAPAGEAGPRITHVGAVAPDVLGITVEAQRARYGGQKPYVPLKGDRRESRDGSVFLHRGGKEIGVLVGAKRSVLWPYEELVGEPLDTTWADRADSYTIVSRKHTAYRDGRKPLAVYRKSKPTDMVQTGAWRWALPQVHVLYLRLGEPLAPGRAYTIRFNGRPLKDVVYTHDPATARSEAVHGTHLGCRPDDPAKVAFLSCWLGSGGKLDYREHLAFRVLDDETGEAAFEGKTVLSLAATAAEDPYKRNYNLVDVHLLAFSSLRRPGTYRVSVEGIGCSYPFEVREDLYRGTFRVAARGFYHQRSGIELRPPYTAYRRPRCFHSGDGVKVYHSTCPLMESGNGLNVFGTDKGNFGNLVAGRTDGLVLTAWGGYHDAGDWDRRIQHLRVSRVLLELAEMFPGYFAKVRLNIPESGNGLPDAVNEALWNLDCYRRMQTPDGGIRGGIE